MSLSLFQKHPQKFTLFLYIGFVIILLFLSIRIDRTKETTNTNLPTQTTSKIFVIKKGDEILYSKKLTSYGYEVVRWHDWLFYTRPNANRASETDIVGLNMKTSERNVLMQNNDTKRQITTLSILNDTLYISFGGQFAEGKMYWTKLPTLNSPKELISMPNPQISFVHKRYWIIGGEGDACWHEGYYAPFDPFTHTIGPIITTHEGCKTGGEAFVGIDKQGRVIVAQHPIQPELFQVKTLYDAPSFSRIVAIEPHTLERKVLLSKEKMPDNIVEIHFDSNRESLLLMGPKIYAYDIGQNKLTYFTSSNEHWVRSEIIRWNNDGICISLWNKQGKQIIIPHSFTNNALNCSINSSPQANDEQDALQKTQQYIQDLHLPKGYNAEIEGQ